MLKTYKLTPGETSTLQKLKNWTSNPVKLVQGSVTRLIKKLLNARDDNTLKEILPDILEFEKSEGHDLQYMRKKFTGDNKSHFTALASPFVGKANRLDDEPVKTQPNLPGDFSDKVLASKLLEPQSGSVQKTQNIDYQKLYDAVQNAKKQYNDAPGKSAVNKLLYYTQPELELLQKYINQTPLKWTKRDSEYLEHVLDPNYKGADKDSFRDRIEWVAKLIANPDQWYNTTSKMVWSEVKNSDIGQWFYKTFLKVGTKFNSAKAQELADSFRKGESTGDKFTMSEKPDPRGGTHSVITPAQPTSQPTTGSRMTGIIPSKGGIIETPVIGLDTGTTTSPDKLDSKYRALVQDAFTTGDDTYRLFVGEKQFQEDFKRIYRRYHKGKDWSDSSQGVELFNNMNAVERQHLIGELDIAIRESLKRQKLPIRDLKYKADPIDYNMEAGALLDDSGRTLLEKYVSSFDMVDKKLIDFITRGQKLPNGKNANQVRSDLLPALQQLRDIYNDPSARVTEKTLQAVQLAMDSIPAGVGLDTITEVGQSTLTELRTRLATDTARRSETQTVETDEDPKPKPPDDPKPDPQQVNVVKKPLTEEQIFASKHKKIPELRPKFGIMSQEELEDTFLGTAEERTVGDMTWKRVDLKHANETVPKGEIEDPYQPLFDHNTKLYNLRFGRTFPMPPPPTPTHRPILLRKPMHDIFDVDTRYNMMDAYDNTQFRGIRDKPGVQQIWESTPQKNKNLNIGGVPVPTYYGGNYKNPMYREREPPFKYSNGGRTWNL